MTSRTRRWILSAALVLLVVTQVATSCASDGVALGLYGTLCLVMLLLLLLLLLGDR